MAGPSPPSALHVADAIASSEALSGLVRRLNESRARFACIEPALPETLRAIVRPGGVDDTTWSLLVPHGAAASKLRQLLPTLEARLRDAGWPERAVRVRVSRP